MHKIIIERQQIFSSLLDIYAMDKWHSKQIRQTCYTHGYSKIITDQFCKLVSIDTMLMGVRDLCDDRTEITGRHFLYLGVLDLCDDRTEIIGRHFLYLLHRLKLTHKIKSNKKYEQWINSEINDRNKKRIQNLTRTAD